MDSVYICTVEQSILREKTFTVNDVTLGQLVDANITEIKDDGLVLKFGNLTGFVENVQISNTAYTEGIKSKFRVNQKVKAR